MGRKFDMENNSIAEPMTTETEMAYSNNITDNSYASSSGSDSEESNASLLERSSLLSNKFMLPKDLCDNGAIFDEFFSHSLWDSLPAAVQQHLTKFLPNECDGPALSQASQVVHSLLSNSLGRFGQDQMGILRYKLSEGNCRVDMARLQHNLTKSTMKDKRMVELQRMARLAQNVVLSREATLLSELHSAGTHSLSTSGRVMDNYKHRRRWGLQLNISPEIEKCQMLAKKRYLSEIVTVSDDIGLSLSISDEEDCLHALPTAPVRKQRRMFGGAGSQMNEQSYHGSVGLTGSASNVGARKSSFPGNCNGAGGNTFDGTSFHAPKLFLVTEEHYRKLLLEHRKRKMEEPEHPELNLDGIKMKDVVSRTQIAAGYRRILPMPKVYVSESSAETPAGGKGRMKSHKLFKMHRTSHDHDSSKKLLVLKAREQKDDLAKAKGDPGYEQPVVKPKDEQPSHDVFETNSLAAKHLVCKEENSTTSSAVIGAPAPAPSVATTAAYKNEKTNMSGVVAAQEPETLLKSEVCLTQTMITPAPNLSLETFTAADSSESYAGELDSINCMFGNNTHACFLSVVRDLFCSNPDHRCTMMELQQKLDRWVKSVAAARNVWYEEYQANGDWHTTLQSAVQFLSGEFQHQPEDFVPYIEHKVALNILQWIGASRDADSRLVPLCTFWQSSKEEINKFAGTHPIMPCSAPSSRPDDSGITVAAVKNRSKSITGSRLQLSSSSSSSSSSSMSSVQAAGDMSTTLLTECGVATFTSAMGSTVQDDDGSISERSVTPPPPLFPTDWSVRKATDEEMQSFREQEKRRYENPHMAFTYKQHSYDSVVGPVKGIYTQAPGISKARGHSMLVADRPNFVTILTLVRDATARLPNGEGTRADICELLKSSQYISPTATDQILQTIVSGALDRMHTEHDPCVKYDAKRKIWIYLHRSRTEQEFERLHMQYQGFTKHKKTVVRKTLKYPKESVSSANLSKGTLLSDSCSSLENFNSSNNSFEMDRDSAITVGSSGAELPVVANASFTAVAQNTPMSTIENPVVNTSGTALSRQTTSLLKRQSSHVSQTKSAVQPQCADRTGDSISSSNSVKALVAEVQQERSKQPLYSIQEPQILSAEARTNTPSGVTLITSSGNNVRTIQIPKGSLTLSSTPAGLINSPTTVNGSDAISQGALTVENATSLCISKSQKNMYVSEIVSTVKPVLASSTTISSTTSKPVADIARIAAPKSIVVQSTGASAPLPAASSTCPAGSTPKDGIKIGTSLGGTIVSIRQVGSSGSGIGIIGSSSQPLVSLSSATSVQSPVLVAPQAKAIQMPIANSTIINSAGGNPLQATKGSSIVAATIGKPVYSTSIGASTLKQSNSSPSILPSGGIAGGATPKMVLSSGTTYAPSTAETSNIPTVVAIKPAGSTNMTTVQANTGARMIKPAANLISTITLAKGQQSVLTPAQQKQIIQNLISQHQKQTLTTKKIVSHTTVIAANTPSFNSKGQIGGETKPSVSGPPFVLENQTTLGTIPAFKIHQNTGPSIRTLSPQIVKITPARTKSPSIASLRPVSNMGTIVGAANASGSSIATTSVINQTASGVKMMKMHPSTILTSTGAQGILNTSSMGAGGALTVTSSAGIGTSSVNPQSHTMRVLKTATGTTTVIKTEVAANSPAMHQLSQGQSAHQGLEKVRKDSHAAQVGSKVIVTPNLSAGQLIPLESLLQKQGITATATNSPVGGNTFLKIAGTTKSGQQQFLQFSTSHNVSSAVTSTSATNVPTISAVASGGHQYTILPQGRNIISVASTAASRPANLPITIVSSPDSKSLPSATAIIVPNKKGTLGETNASSGTSASLLTHAASTTVGRQHVQQGTKVKLLTTTPSPVVSFSTASLVSAAQQQQPNAVFTPKSALSTAVGGEFLNAKIIGVRNVAASKLKGTSSLSLMNAGNLNIAHIGGKPVIIASNSGVGTNQSITVSTAHFNNTNSSKCTTAGGMVVATSANCSNILLDQQTPNEKNIPSTASTVGREGDVTNIVNGIPGQMQTVMLRNNLLKVQAVPPATVARLPHQKTNATILVGSSGLGSGMNTVTNNIITAVGRSSVVQQQEQQTQPNSSQTFRFLRFHTLAQSSETFCLSNRNGIACFL
uniref:Uncharacterized protein n=1 Tax=Anopheles dirus TaxID=7168 RepID=A0A182N8Y3_9DIPT